ncbi:malate synthase G [Vibrio neptunius]|uniref:malate synthase G n=1 Tax=Vibrio neptunius TaxID=170651 RepID=UPI000B2DE975|nr:malate synthase G [Vibrio neptunius]
MNYLEIHKIHVNGKLAELINTVLRNQNIDKEAFWRSLSEGINELGVKNHALIAKRKELQAQISQWHEKHNGDDFCFAKYRKFLTDIGYLVEEKQPFIINSNDIDPEVKTMAGPQLVVPINNERFALNAANARWGSLYDAMYGTDATGSKPPSKEFNVAHAEKAIQQSMRFLDTAIPLMSGSYQQVTALKFDEGSKRLTIELEGGQITSLANESQLIGQRSDGQTEKLLFKNNQLHIEIGIDANSPTGRLSKAGISDVQLESALSTIMDCEDSVAAVDADDKLKVYENWLGLMNGSLSCALHKNGQWIERSLNPDRVYNSTNSDSIVSVAGRSLLLVRNVGHLMTTDLILDENGDEAYEGIVDGFVTALIALENRNSTFKNGQHDSIYIVKPKMHGPEEVEFTNTLFNKIEDSLNLKRHTIKVGVMDEERRTSANLMESVRAVKDRIFFINTGFLDRTGDDIHTISAAGVVPTKSEMKSQPWLEAYESGNVNTGLKLGFLGGAQIGKGMWAMPDEMAKMLEQKITHPKAGATCAWVPSPTAATLHATHYHQHSVLETQKSMLEALNTNNRYDLEKLLTPYVYANSKTLATEAIQTELDNNIQSILGYVVRWIDQGIGCSKVLDINNVGLMEDRATLRISSQLISNWFAHSVCSEEQINETLWRMAGVVDEQNSSDPHYVPMLSNFENNLAVLATRELIFHGASQPNGYTEPVLHRYRKLSKKQNS